MKIFQSAELFLRKFTKYPTLLSFVFSIILLSGWLLDHFAFNKTEKDNRPIFTIYNQPASTLPPSVIEFKPSIAREWQMGIGSMITQAPNGIELYKMKIIDSYLLIKMPEEKSFRAFPTDNLPTTIMINSKLGKHIISVEDKNPSGYKMKVYDAPN